MQAGMCRVVNELDMIPSYYLHSFIGLTTEPFDRKLLPKCLKQSPQWNKISASVGKSYPTQVGPRQQVEWT